MARKTSSPLGSAHSEGMRKRAQKSAAYKAALEEQKPYEEFARLVIGKRMQLGLTQKELAERMGTSHAAISRMESGQHGVSFSTMRRVAKALNTRLVYGFEDEVTEKKSRRAPKRDLVVSA